VLIAGGFHLGMASEHNGSQQKKSPSLQAADGLLVGGAKVGRNSTKFGIAVSIALDTCNTDLFLST